MKPGLYLLKNLANYTSNYILRKCNLIYRFLVFRLKVEICTILSSEVEEKTVVEIIEIFFECSIANEISRRDKVKMEPETVSSQENVNLERRGSMAISDDNDNGNSNANVKLNENQDEAEYEQDDDVLIDHVGKNVQRAPKQQNLSDLSENRTNLVSISVELEDQNSNKNLIKNRNDNNNEITTEV